jgi:hypothetical protein
MIIDDKGRLFKKINLIDLLIILIIVAAGILVFNKFGRAKVVTPLAKQEPVAITFIIESLPEYAADNVEINDPVIDRVTSAYLGKVVSVEKKPDRSYAPDQDGRYVRSSKEGYCSLEFTVEGTGVFDGKVVNIGNTNYYVYRDTTLYVGDTMLFTRVKDIEKK